MYTVKNTPLQYNSILHHKLNDNNMAPMQKSLAESHFNPLQGGISFQQNGIRYNTYPDVNLGFLLPGNSSMSTNSELDLRNQSTADFNYSYRHKHKERRASKSSRRLQETRSHYKKKNGVYNQYTKNSKFPYKENWSSDPLSTPPLSPHEPRYEDNKYFNKSKSTHNNADLTWNYTFFKFSNWINSRIQALNAQLHNIENATISIKQQANDNRMTDCLGTPTSVESEFIPYS